MKIKRDLKNKIVIAVSTLVATIVCLTLQYSQKEKLRIASLSQEIQRSMSYEQFADEDAIVEDTNNHVKFSAFFLRDIDGDGYAEPLKGTCKEIGKQDTLYMELNVITEGRIENAKIEINGQNFLFGTVLPKDRILKNNYIGNDIRKLELNPMNNGTQKMMHGIVRSGNYSSPSRKASAIGNNINNYSRNDNEVVLTGTYINGDNEPTEIRKVINLTVDWYGTTQAKINNLSQTNNNLDRIIDEENEKISCGFTVQTEETKKELNLYSNYVEGIIPELNGYAPLEVSTTSDNVEFTYNEQERKFTVKRTATADGTGKITKSVGKINSYGIKVVYPLEAYQSLGEEAVTIKIPVETYYEGYNNPNSEFQNPYKSNVAKDVIVASYRKAIVSPPPGVTIVPAGIDITVGRYVYNPTSRYIISKEKPLKIYNGVSEEEKDDNYTVRWAISTGTNGQSTGLKLKETKDGETQKVDHFIKTDSTEDSMENVTTNTAIYFSGADKVLEDDGWIKIYDEETGNLLVTLTKETWGKYTSSSPYKYELPVKHIRIETSATKAKSTLYVYNIKTLDDTYITNNYTREQFDNLKYIKSNLAGWLGEKSLGTDTHQALYEAPYCIAEIDISNKTISTQETEKHEIITIKATEDKNSNITGWYNGSFLVKMPAEVLTVDINNVSISNNRVKITSYEVVEIDGSRFIKINTQNNNTDAESYTITIDADITPDPRGVTVSRDIELYASNEMGVDYYYKSEDTFDVNDNLNKLEIINKTSTNISLISPNVLLTNQTLSNYDKIGSTIVSPQIADIAPKYGTVDNDENEATIGIQLINNYTSDISEVILLGKIPFEGNTYVLGEEDLNSSFTTKMKNTGIQIPESLEGKITVYYSEKENTNKEIKNEANEWKKAEDVTDWSKIKTFAIDFEDTVIDPNKEYVFYYTIQVPNGIEFNKIAYSHHGIYFAVHTDEGKYRTSTEPNKLGIRIAEKYDLELTKYQTGKDKKIAGATYSIVEEGQEEGRTATTNSDGTLKIDNLYAERTYIVREIKSPNEYEISNEEIKIIGHIDRENGTLTIEKESGTTRGNIEVTKIEGQNYKVLLNVEDEAKAKLRITKTEQLNGTRIEKVTYKITGEGLPQSGRRLTTNTQGEATISGLKIGVEYTLEETKAEGYYLAEPVKLRISNNEGTYSVEITEGAIKESSITEEESLPTADIVLEDEKIPTYNLELTKIKKVTKLESSEGGESQPNTQEITYLAGAKFRLYKGDEKIGDYISDENGKIEINNLYQYVEGKDFEATYVLKEILPPEGYAKVKDITFKVQRTEGGSLEFKEELAEGQSAKTYTVDDESKTVKVTVEDSPSFKLTKKDGETDQLLANCKFAIYNVDNNQTPATNSKGEIIGERQTINGQEYYVVTTDANGEITADLPEGFYKAVELEANDEKYDLQGQTYYFGIGASREPKTIMSTEWATSLGGQSSTYINSVIETEDGGIVAGGYYYKSIKVGDKIYNNDNSVDKYIIVKYDKYGNVLWSDSPEGNGGSIIKTMTQTSDGKIIIGGELLRGISTIGGFQVKANRLSDGFLAKYNSNGEVEWARSIEDDMDNGYSNYGNIEVNSVDIYHNDSIIVGGYFNLKINIEGTEFNTTNSIRQNDGLLLSFNTNGELEWATKIGGAKEDTITNVKNIKDEGYAVCGYFNETMEIGDKQLTSKGKKDGFIIKYTNDNEIEWTRSIGGTDDDTIEEITDTLDGGIVAVGNFKGTIETTEKNLISTGEQDGFAIKYKDNEIEWIESISTTGKTEMTTIVESKEGDIEMCGCFSGKLQLDEKQIETYGYKDSFIIIRSKDDGKIQLKKQIGGSQNTQIEKLIEMSDGITLVAGEFSGIISTSDKVLKSNGVNDGFIIKTKEKEIPTIHTDWIKNIGCSSSDEITSIIETSDGGFVVGGSFYGSMQIEDIQFSSKNKEDGVVIKYNNAGKIEWANTIDIFNYDEVKSITETKDGEIIVGGFRRSRKSKCVQRWIYCENKCRW